MTFGGVLNKQVSFALQILERGMYFDGSLQLSYMSGAVVCTPFDAFCKLFVE